MTSPPPTTAPPTMHHHYALKLSLLATFMFSAALCAAVMYKSTVLHSTKLSAKHKHGYYVITVMLFVYAFSIFVTMYNKWLLSYWDGGFHFPLGITAFHFLTKGGLSLALLWFKRRGSVDHHREGKPEAEYFRFGPLVPVERTTLYKVIIPIGVATGLHVALGALAYRWMTVSAMTFVKSSGLSLNLLFSILLGVLVLTWKIGVSVGIMTVGFLLATLGTHGTSNWFGFVLVFAGTLLGEIKCVLIQISFQKIEAKLTPLDLVVYISPPAFVFLFVNFLIFELVPMVRSDAFMHHPLELIGFVLLGTVVVFGMVYAEMEFTRNTSSLTYATASVFKEILLIAFACIVYQDKISFLNVLGMAVVIVGVLVYTRWQLESDGLLYDDAAPTVDHPAAKKVDESEYEGLLSGESGTDI